MITDAPRSGALQILWGSGNNCRSESEISSFYYPFGYNRLGAWIAVGADLNADGYGEVVFSHGNGADAPQTSLVLDGSLLAMAPSRTFNGSSTEEGPFYAAPSHYYEWISEYVMDGVMDKGGCRIDMTEDTMGSLWLASGCPDEDTVELYLYDETTSTFEDHPHTIVGSSSNHTNWKGNLGATFMFHEDRLLIGAPNSNLLGPSIGGAIQFDVTE